MVIKFQASEHGPAGKLAEVELWFDDGDGVLAGLKLIGFAVWERTRRPGEFNVTFPARQYSVNGERRSFALLRPVGVDVVGGYVQQFAAERLRDVIIDGWRAYVELDRLGEAGSTPVSGPIEVRQR